MRNVKIQWDKTLIGKVGAVENIMMNSISISLINAASIACVFANTLHLRIQIEFIKREVYYEKM
jgi:hypothetical protein